MSQQILALLSRPLAWFVALGVVAFLALYGILRGAPPGQPSPEEPGEGAPSPAHRDRVLVGVLVGLLLVASGALVAVEVGVPWSLPPFAVGIGTVFALVRANRRYRHASPTLRRVIRFADTALTASLLAGVLVVGNVLAFKYGERPIDFTRERVFSLESLTVNQLRSLERPVRFTVFHGDDRRTRRQLGRVVQLLELYKAENPRMVGYEVVHPFSNPAQFDQLKKRAPGVAVTPNGGVVVEYGEESTADRVVVPNADLFDPGSSAEPGPSPGSLATSFRGEDALTSALIRLRESKRPKVAFVTGHGEPSIHEMDVSKPGLGLLRARLESLGAEVTIQNLVLGRLAPDVAAAIVVGPRSQYETSEIRHLRDYSESGGHLVLLLDGRVKTGLEPWLETFGLKLGPGLIVDPRANFGRDPFSPYAPILGDSRHPIVASLLNQYVIAPQSTPMVVGPEAGERPSPKPAGVVARPILRTSPSSWAESDPDARRLEREPGKDRPGPLVVGAAVSRVEGAGAGASERPGLVVFSSPLLADNRVAAFDATNLDLIVNSVNWLRGRPDLQGLSPRKHVALVLPADPGLRQRLVLLPTVIAFFVIIAAGVATYLARRS